MKLSINLIENNSEIQKRILNALSPQIQTYLTKIEKQISSEIPKIVINGIKNQPEYSAIVSGRLQYEFGIQDPQNKLNDILNTIESSLKVTIRQPQTGGSRINGTIKLQMVQSNFADLLSLGSASFVSEKGSQINWLDWLLTQGDSTIIAGYSFIAGSFPTSRTGGGIMMEFESSFWRVPPEYAGTTRDNWITRGIESVTSQIQKELENIVSKT
jgi:hypothetical protein